MNNCVYSSWLVTVDIQIKLNDCTSTRMAKSAGCDAVQLELAYIALGNGKCYSYFGEKIAVSL